MKKSITAPIALAAFLFAGCCTTQHATTWEYRMAGTISEVNQLSAQGWTVVSFTMPPAGGPNQYLMKHGKP